jgi:hypothetical protein
MNNSEPREEAFAVVRAASLQYKPRNFASGRGTLARGMHELETLRNLPSISTFWKRSSENFLCFLLYMQGDDLMHEMTMRSTSEIQQIEVSYDFAFSFV